MAASEYAFLPRLSAFPNPGSVLVLDNRQIHHTHETAMRAIVETAGAKFLFLAPYSPIDSPIEMVFNVLKAFWTRHAEHLQHLPVREAAKMCLFSCYEDKEAATALVDITKSLPPYSHMTSYPRNSGCCLLFFTYAATQHTA